MFAHIAKGKARAVWKGIVLFVLLIVPLDLLEV